MNDRRRIIDNLNNHLLVPEPVLGESYAEKEWDQNEDRSVSTFVHTGSYLDFCKRNVLFLFGRRGTGKTTLIRMLEYDVLRGKVPEYAYCRRLDQENAFNEFAIQIRATPLGTLPPNELVHLLKKKWRWVLAVTAMQSVIDNPRDSESSLQGLPNVYAYLKAQDLLPGSNGANRSPLARLVGLTYTAFRNDTSIGEPLVPIYEVMSELTSDLFQEALSELSGFLLGNRQSCVVLVDSVEYYHLDDDIAKAVRTALIETVRMFYDTAYRQGIYVKAAFPSEIFPHLTSENQEKIGARNLFIIWQFHDLACLVAKRYQSVFHRSDVAYGSLDDFHKAIAFLYTYMPPQVTTRIGLVFDTLAYLIEHTQKKPREIISLFNTVLTLGKQEDPAAFPVITGDVVQRGIHYRLDLLVSGALNMYEQIYPQADQIVRRALTEMPVQFPMRRLEKRLPELSAIRAKHQLSLEQVKRLLLECGALGQVVEEHPVAGTKKYIVEAVFEYQVKGILTPTSDTVCVIHPMFYQELRSVLAEDRLIYPMPAEDTESKVLAAAGINLA